METEFKENVTYYTNRLRDEGLIEGEVTSVRPETQSFSLKTKQSVLTRDFYVKLEDILSDAIEWTGKDYYWYVMHLYTTQAMELTIQLL